MKRQVLSIVSTVFLGAVIAACKSAPEPERTPVPTERGEERTERTEPMERRTPAPETQRPTEDVGRTGDVATTERLHDEVHAALDRAEGLDSSQIRVVVAENGVVHLSGTVASEEEKRRAHEIAHSVPGVKNVYIGQLEIDTASARR
jgi:osmotically-inducible protein OsmY